MSLILANTIGYITAHWRWFAIAALAVFVLVFGLWAKSCLTKTPKLDTAAIEKAQKAIAEQDRKVMIEVLAESDAKEAVADGIVNNAKAETINKEAESKAKWAAANNADLAAELERRARQ